MSWILVFTIACGKNPNKASMPPGWPCVLAALRAYFLILCMGISRAENAENVVPLRVSNLRKIRGVQHLGSQFP